MQSVTAEVNNGTSYSYSDLPSVLNAINYEDHWRTSTMVHYDDSGPNISAVVAVMGWYDHIFFYKKRMTTNSGQESTLYGEHQYDYFMAA